MNDKKMNFKFPEPPTPEEHRRVSLAWLGRVQPTLIDQWPADLAALSMPTQLIKVDAGVVFQAVCDLQEGKPYAPVLTELARELDGALGWERKFFRLNSRSPKDNLWPFSVGASMSGREIVSVMSGSERVIDDLIEFSYVPEQPAYVCLRDYVWGVRSVNEFRCFVRNGDLIAVTHYDYTQAVPEYIAQQADEIRRQIDAWFAEKLKPALHLDTVVFDVALINGDLLLIEINPFGSSDPCWFGSYEAILNATGSIQMSHPEPA